MQLSKILFLIIFNFNLIFGNNFKTIIISNGFIDNQVQVILYQENKTLSFLSYTKIPFSNKFFIHSVFTWPEFRRQGLAKKLLEYTVDLLKKEHATAIYIQPGPYEIINFEPKEIVQIAERQSKLNTLVKFYSSLGFAKASFLTSKFAYIIYKIIGLDQDPAYLMVKYI